MANAITIQTIVDGPRNTVIKVEGVLDTSDIVATGNIGASGFTTTIGSPIVTFVAGTLIPTPGQYVTFSDGTTTFPLTAYILSVTDATHFVMSSNALANNAAAAITITGTAGSIVIADPSLMASIDGGRTKALKYRINRLMFTVEDALELRLAWGATVPVRIETLQGRGDMKYNSFNGVVNNAGAGVNGTILLSSQGWVASSILSFSLILELIKQQN